MTTSIILTDLARKCSAITKEKGFFDVWQGDEIGLLKHNVLQQYGELAEAYEAKRKGRFYSGTFEKDTFEDELADVCIFGLSCLGYFEYDILFESFKPDNVIYECSYESFYIHMMQPTYNLEYKKYNMLGHINFIIVSLICFCEYKGIDIFMHIEQKMQYNAGREKLHGKKF